MELCIKNLSKQFGSAYAVDQVSFSLKPGVYGLLGANGAGKTTLMRMVCSILSPTYGQVLYDGTDINQLGDKYRQLLGYLPQDFGYYPEFTAKEYIKFIAAVKGMKKKGLEEKVAQVLRLTNLSDVANKRIRTFSGGMKQRLGIAQAVINDPKILVLDEPTAGLDPKERMRFRNLIAELSKDRIILLSTHIVSDIDYIADELLMIKKGQLVVNCSTEEALLHMESKVWECTVPQSSVGEMTNRFSAVNLHSGGKTGTNLRIVSDTAPCREAKCVEPSLEDLYLYYFVETDMEEGK